MEREKIFGHLLAIVTIIIWGTTFVSTKVLLREFSPEEILIYRFFIAFLILISIYPKNIKLLSVKEEGLFCLLGVTGISLYFWTENLALKYTQASNVGLIVSAIPVFTALIMHFIFKDEKISLNFLVGFLLAMMGICIIIYNGRVLRLNPLGDFLAVISALLFAIYSILIKKVSSEYNQLFVVRKIFFYGVITMIPIIFIRNINLLKISNLTISISLNMLYLSIFASVLCFIMWNKSVKIIGSLKTTNYIYLVPMITMISSTIILNEKVSLLMLFGGGLILSGVYLNNSNLIKIKRSILTYNQRGKR